jgi:1-acyl-sn-glycerol-3-phosphate acyltransferase
MPSKFIAPKLNRSVVGAMQLAAPLYLKVKSNLQVDVEPSVADAFNTVDGAPAIVCPNHPAGDDVFVAFALSRAIKQQFYFLTTREIFRWHPTLRSLWLQNLGCYSILRAAPDVESFKTSRRLLSSGDHKLLIFPEGEISHQNKFLLPLELGPALLALDVAEEKVKTTLDGPIFIVPVAIVYRFAQDVTAELKAVLRACEDKLGITSHNTWEVSTRLYRCFDTMLSVLEQEHHIARKPSAPLERRISNVCEHLAQEYARELQIQFPKRMDLIDKLHLLKNELTERRYCEGIEPDEKIRALYAAIVLTTALLAVRERSFVIPTTQEEVAELLEVLNLHVLEKSLPKFAKRAIIGAGQPIDVRPALEIFRKDRRQAVRYVAGRLADSLEETIADLLTEHRSITSLFY